MNVADRSQAPGSSGRQDRRAVRAAGVRVTRSSAASDRCVAASYRRMDSTMSPMNSRRTGLRLGRRIEVDDAAADAELAVFVDRILRKEARASRGVRPGPAARSRCPARSTRPTAAESRRIAQARQQRARRHDDEPRRAGRQGVTGRGPAPTPPSRCGVSPRYGSTSSDGNGSTASAASRSDRPSSVDRKNRASAVISLDVRVGRHDEDDGAVLREGGGVKRRAPQASGRSAPANGRCRPARVAADLSSDRKARDEVAVIARWTT